MILVISHQRFFIFSFIHGHSQHRVKLDPRALMCIWVKYKADSTSERYKTKFAAKGYLKHTRSIAPIAKMNTIHVLLSLAANLGWSTQQLDVKNIFLHGVISRKKYMEASPGSD